MPEESDQASTADKGGAGEVEEGDAGRYICVSRSGSRQRWGDVRGQG